jgi:Tat protein secretion system quality control protein TatD with DNase activity
MSGAAASEERFPWDIGVFDAHCHPTDTMASVAFIPHMRARALTVMSTRAQDQHLVSDVCVSQGVRDEEALLSGRDVDRRIVPAFGWHPWFSYQLYDDTSPTPTYDGTPEGKVVHYDKILTPSPSSKDGSFGASLAEPRPLSDFLRETRARLEQHPAALVGEIGLDKAFRIPESWTGDTETARDEELTPGGREGRRLSPHRVSVDHQVMVLQAQLRLAGEMNRAVSVHGVQMHGGVYNAIAACWKGHETEVLSRRKQRRIAADAENFSEDDDEPAASSNSGARSKETESQRKGGKPFPPRICLHSYSGPANVMTQYTHKSVPAKVFFSFSSAINWDPESSGAAGDKNKKTEEVIRACPDDRILVESDLHTAGERMDQALEGICRKICEIKGWELRKGVQQLARNYREFVFDNEAPR